MTLGPPAEASSPPGVSPGPQTFPMSPSAEGQDHTSVVSSSSLVPSLANAPVLSVGPPNTCQSSQTFDPLQARDPWQSWHSGRGSQRDVTQALWAQHGPTTTSVRSVNPMSQPYRDFSGHSGDGVTADQSGDGGRSSQDVSGVGWTGTFHHPTSSWSRSSFGRSYATTAAIGTDFDRCCETRKPTTAATTTPPVGVPERERLTMDTKWIPAMPLPSFKQ